MNEKDIVRRLQEVEERLAELSPTGTRVEGEAGAVVLADSEAMLEGEFDRLLAEKYRLQQMLTQPRQGEGTD